MPANVRDNNKRIAKNTLALYTRQIVVMLVTLYTSRVVLNTLGVDDFGIYNVVGGVVLMFSFITGTMASASQRYIAYDIAQKDQQRTKETFSMIILSYIMLAVVFFILAESVAVWFLNTQMSIPPERTGAANWVLQFAILSFLITIFQMPYVSMIIAQESMNVYAYISVVEAFLRLTIAYCLVISSFDKLKTYAVLMTLSVVVVFLCYRLYCKRKFVESHFKFFYEDKRFRELLSYAGWNVIGALANVLRSQGINILLNIFFYPAINAARGIAYQVNNAIMNFSNNFYTAVRPQLVKNYAIGDKARMNDLVIVSSRFAFYLLLILSLPIFINTQPILFFWLKTPPEYASLFVKIVLLNALVEVFSMPLVNGIQATGYIRTYQSIASVLYLLVLPISYVLLRHGYPPETPMLVNIVLVIIAVIPRLVLSHRQYGLPIGKYCINVFAHVFITAGVCYFLCIASLQILSPPSSLWHLLWTITVNIICSVVVIFTIGLTHRERKYLLRIARNKMKK